MAHIGLLVANLFKGVTVTQTCAMRDFESNLNLDQARDRLEKGYWVNLIKYTFQLDSKTQYGVMDTLCSQCEVAKRLVEQAYVDLQPEN